MPASFDENGPTVVGNKVMISGITTTGAATTVDVSPYMNVIEQIIVHQDASAMFPVQFRNQADDANLEIRADYFAQQVTNTTFKFLVTATPIDGQASETTQNGLFVVIGRK
jgi:hypothetical protein